MALLKRERAEELKMLESRPAGRADHSLFL